MSERSQRIRKATGIAVLAGLLLLLIFHRPLLRAMGRNLVVDDPPAKSDAIILLGSESGDPGPLRKTVELYRAGWAPHVVAAGRYLRPYLSVSELVQRDLINAGLPEEAIVLLPHGRNDRLDESETLRNLLRGRGWRKVIFVTANHHARRVHDVFTRDLGDLAEVRVVAAAQSSFDPENWWQSRRTAGIVVREYLALLQVCF